MSYSGRYNHRAAWVRPARSDYGSGLCTQNSSCLLRHCLLPTCHPRPTHLRHPSLHLHPILPPCRATFGCVSESRREISLNKRLPRTSVKREFRLCSHWAPRIHEVPPSTDAEYCGPPRAFLSGQGLEFRGLYLSSRPPF